MARTYDPKDVTVVLDGVFITGFQEGSFVQASKDEENFSTKVSAQGEVAVAFSNNPLGTITLTLSATSPSLPYIKQKAKSKTPFPIWVTYSGDPKEVSGGTEALIKKAPDKEYGDEVGDREVEIQVLDYTEE
ncbi:DUF3277 domain-containing protein [Bacillus methanolicus]|uniref:phage structural protein n=1 Tax=Bacillus methanolicus TaxID=1471 RepID=UPI002380833E|nr:DUF3277 domain-containing protein [Bacillus methanolicus]MDE3837936.1 DUF3277 domain-containing protein [Bacillus methanolicus]